MTQSPFVKLAIKAIESYVWDEKIVKAPAEFLKERSGKAGVFVSLKKHGRLRGCIGTFEPTTDNIAEEIIRNAIAASTQDPRFSPVTSEEVGELEVSVDVLTSPEKVGSVADLDAKKFGVIVQSGGKKGLLLPDLEGVNSPEEQITICKQKAGIFPDDEVELFRFQVTRYF